MIPPQCGMLTIGALPITLPLRITSAIFSSVLNSLRKSGARERRDRLVRRLRVRHAAEAVRAVAVDAAVADVERGARDGGALARAAPATGVACRRPPAAPRGCTRRGRRPASSRSPAPQTGMYGCVGFADSPSPWLMMCVSWADRELWPTVFSAGTAGETPPRPCRPWHWAQANWTKSCAPAATCGDTFAEAARRARPDGLRRDRLRLLAVVAGRVRDDADGDRDRDAGADHRRQDPYLAPRALVVRHWRIFHPRPAAAIRT